MCATRSRNALQKIDGLLPRVAHDTEVRHHVEAHDEGDEVPVGGECARRDDVNRDLTNL